MARDNHDRETLKALQSIAKSLKAIENILRDMNTRDVIDIELKEEIDDAKTEIN